MTRAAQPPGSRDEMVSALMGAYWKNPNVGVIHDPIMRWNCAAELVQSWIAYERNLTSYAIDSKLKAERERAIEEAAQCCDVLSEKSRALPEFNSMASWCADAIRALKVIP